MTRLDVLGAINQDVVARVHRAPALGETVADGVLTHQPGGKGANQAAAAARLGADVRMLGAVGRDAAADQMLAALSSAGVDASAVQTADEATGTALIVVDEAGENSIVVCPGANARIDPGAWDRDPAVPVLAQLEVAPDTVDHLARTSTGLFALNVSPARELGSVLWNRVGLFIVNEGEYAALPRLATAALVALTLGAEGAVLLRRGVEVASAPSVPTSVVNTVGAGDAFAAALTVGLLRGLDEEVALRAACAVGAAAVADERSQPLLQPLDAYLG
ncbi:ribokinase [Microbacterium protaetiae]|uniref:Ribokinase n=1 Tax=Microbacterium protaetiae TaxID=2509458 RepID=A0A4P6EDC8_9MICO|nr:PfkB family carbohydrate kinase [Microbacterium protaetiae]QAY60124.1 ribokinase [Microbacterium protaetiae]